MTAKDEWLPTSTFPTSVHVELIKLGKIPDPYIGLNEWDVQCKNRSFSKSTHSRPWELPPRTRGNTRGTAPHYRDYPAHVFRRCIALINIFILYDWLLLTLHLGVGEADWQFRTSFELQAKQLSDPNADLVFDGLDTYCTVELVSQLSPFEAWASAFILFFYAWLDYRMAKLFWKQTTCSCRTELP